MIFSVPCCQHEVNKQIQSEDYSLLTRYGIIKERFSALTTDAIRANLLECCGYKTQLLEFIDFEHTPKNILIRAVRRPVLPSSAKKKYLAEVENMCREFHLEPTLYTLLRNDCIVECKISRSITSMERHDHIHVKRRLKSIDVTKLKAQIVIAIFLRRWWTWVFLTEREKW